MRVNVNSLCGERRKSLGNQHAIFINLKTGAAGRAGLVARIEKSPTVTHCAASGTLAFYHISSISILCDMAKRHNIMWLRVCQSHIRADTEKEQL